MFEDRGRLGSRFFFFFFLVRVRKFSKYTRPNNEICSRTDPGRTGWDNRVLLLIIVHRVEPTLYNTSRIYTFLPLDYPITYSSVLWKSFRKERLTPRSEICRVSVHGTIDPRRETIIFPPRTRVFLYPSTTVVGPRVVYLSFIWQQLLSVTFLGEVVTELTYQEVGTV